MFVVEKIEVDVAKRSHITNSYIGYDTVKKQGVIIDPGYDALKIINKIKEINVNIKYILITHGHADHIGALQELKDYTNAHIFISKNDYYVLFGKKQGYFEMLGVDMPNISSANKLNDRDKIKIGNYELDVIETPGHTSGSLCFYESTSNIIFTGDTIFSNCYGRCDLESGDFSEMKKSLNKIFNLFNDDTIIYPGHGEISTLKNAKRYIKFLIHKTGDNDELF